MDTPAGQDACDLYMHESFDNFQKSRPSDQRPAPLANKRNILALVFLFIAVFCLGYWSIRHSSQTGLDTVTKDVTAYPKPMRYLVNVNGSRRELSKSRILSENTHGDVILNIDLDINVPSVDELYEKLVLVTSFSENHYEEALGFIETAQDTMPEKLIIVYDLGLTTEQRSKVEALCGVHVRTFPFEKYPPYFKNFLTYAFKPTIINMVLNEFGIVYYGDASIRFLKPVKELIPDALKHHGFVVHIRSFDPKIHLSDFDLTVKEVYPILGVNRAEVARCNLSFPSISAGLMLLVNNTYLQQGIMKPWKRCALNEACIAPKGASLRNHRFDQSALSLLAYKNMYKEFTPENDPTRHHLSVVKIRRGSKATKYPKKCVGIHTKVRNWSKDFISNLWPPGA